MLSEREKEILIWVAQGLSNRQIAVQLAISENTVKVHLRNIFAKINVSSRTEAGLYAVRQGLLVIEPVLESPEPQMTPRPVPRNRWSWWFVGLVSVAGMVVLWWWLWSAVPPAAELPTAGAELSRWRQVPALPRAQSAVQFVAYRGTLYALCGIDDSSRQWWQYAAGTQAWVAQAPLPFACRSGTVVAHRGWLWVFEHTSNHVWRWDGTDWQQVADIAISGEVHQVIPWGERFVAVVSHAQHEQLWGFDSTSLQWRMLIEQQQSHPWYVVELNDVVYVFGDGKAVWHYDEVSQRLQADVDLPFVWQGALATEVLGSLLLIDPTSQMMWSYVPQQGVVGQQALPATLNGFSQVVPWQAELVMPSRDGSEIWRYQAVYQTFVPVME